MMHMIFLHGWGQDSSFFKELASAYNGKATCHLLDLPGFGKEPAPTEAWSVSGYADFVASYCRENKIEQAVLVGHSFGGKVSALLAVQAPELVHAVIMIASSGLKKKRSSGFKLKAFFLRMLGKLARLSDTVFKTNLRTVYRNKFGSADYRNAQGVMKDVLVKTVSEDIGDKVTAIKVPTLLIYGEKDGETPPEIGQRYNQLIDKSEYVCLPRQDHYSLLSSGRFQVQNHIDQFLTRIG